MSQLTDESEYICRLDYKSLAVARAELNEDDKNRDGAVRTLRLWIKQQDWLNIPTGTDYLMQYLRNTKFSQLGARAKLESGWTYKGECAELFKDRDPTDDNIRRVLKLGFLLRLPKTDETGRTYIMTRPGCLDMDLINSEMGGKNVPYRALTCVLDWICMDERAIVNGVVFIADQSGLKASHRTHLYTLENIKRITKSIQQVYPIRIKKVNIYNSPVFMEAVVAIFKTFMKPKIRDRMEVHGKNLVSVYKTLDKSVLPVEYLPDDYRGPNGGSVQSIIDYMIEGLSQPNVVEYVKTVSQCVVDLDKKPANVEPAASFRKINLD